MECVEGKITALSHIIYINPKTLFMEISLGAKKWNVMITNRTHLQQWKKYLSVRQWIKISQLKRVTLYPATENATSVFETTCDSVIVPIPKGIVQNPSSKNNCFINYEGEVTDDSFASSGFYRLDNAFTLCLAYAKLVTSLPVIRKGDKIILHDCHRSRFGEDVVIFICGRGNLVNKSHNDEKDSLFPKSSSKEDSNNFLQHIALDTNCSIRLLYSFHKLSQQLCKNLCNEIIPMESVTRKFASVNQKGVLSVLMDHFSSTIMQTEAKARSFSREFLRHDSAGCAPSSNKEPFWNVEVWPLNVHEIEKRCDDLMLWIVTGNENSNDKASKPETRRYWEHEAAMVESRTDRICLLIGVLSFRNGRWELRDINGSIEVVAADRDYLQFRERLVFATRFVVHRETFTVDHSSHQRIYISIDTFQAASLPLSHPEGALNETDDQVEGLRFLVLNKSMPQFAYITMPAIRHMFGYLVFALLHTNRKEEDQPNRKRPKKDHPIMIESSVSGEETGPSKCLLFFQHDHPCISYPDLVEGRVYHIRLSRQKLMSNPISLAALKDVYHLASNLKDRVFLVPENTSIQRVPYNLPKSESFMRHDVLRASECMSLSEDEVGSFVSVRGRIVDRMHMEPQYASEKSGQTFTIQRGTWLGIPGNKKIVLKMGDDRGEASFGSKIDIYFNLREGHVYPLGLFLGTEVELTLLCLRKTQKNGRLYCTSTSLTAIRFLKIGRHFGGERRPRLELVKDSCLGRRFLSQLEDPGRVCPKDVFRCLVTVRYIHKLTISSACPGCGAVVTRGTCTYAGCRWNQPGFKVDLKAWCTVEDGSGTALLFISGDCCRKWLKLPAGVWKILEDQVLPHDGEFVYPSVRSRPLGSSLAVQILYYYCDVSVNLRRPLHIMADVFVNNSPVNGEGTTTTAAYYLKDHPSKRLFCLHVDELDPAACAVELSSSSSEKRNNRAKGGITNPHH